MIDIVKKVYKIQLYLCGFQHYLIVKLSEINICVIDKIVLPIHPFIIQDVTSSLLILVSFLTLPE